MVYYGGDMKITIQLISTNMCHSRFSIWVNGGLICEPGNIILRNEEVKPFVKRLQPNVIYDMNDNPTTQKELFRICK